MKVLQDDHRKEKLKTFSCLVLNKTKTFKVLMIYGGTTIKHLLKVLPEILRKMQ